MSQRSGQTAVMMVLSLTMIFGLMGFSVDLGSAYYQKQRAQGAAESAALAAATYAKTNGVTCSTNGITCNSTPTSCSNISSGVLYVGCQYANKNGFPMNSISMAANLTSTSSPPCSNCGSPTYWIQAQIATTNHNLFLGVADFANANINAQAVAGVTSQTTGSGSTVPADCLWVLDPTDKNTFLVSGASVTLTNCKAQINSTADDGGGNGWQPTNEAANANGSSTLTGTYNVVGGASSPPNQSYCHSPMVCHQSSIADPLSGLRSVNEQSDIGTTSCTKSSQYSISQGTVTVLPGIYCGGINISGGTVTFQTGGIYEIRNGNLSISNGTTTGTNVMFWFNTTTPSTSADPVVNINTSSVTLSAPNSGAFKGILFYGNRSAQIAATGTYNVIQASAVPSITGTFYFPTGNFEFSGQAGVNGYVAIIAYRVQINGQSTFKWDSTGAYTGLATYSSGTTTTYTPNLIQ